MTDTTACLLAPPPAPHKLWPPALLQLSLLPEEDPTHQQHELCLADAYARTGRYAEAARQYRQLLWHEAEDPGKLPEPRVEVLCRLPTCRRVGGEGGERIELGA